jgi:hypothetical protein
MAFGLCSSPATYARVINLGFELESGSGFPRRYPGTGKGFRPHDPSFQDKNFPVYPVVLASGIPHEHFSFGGLFPCLPPFSFLTNLRAVLVRLREYGLTLKPQNCKLFQKEIEFLGRVVEPRGMHIGPGYVKNIATLI